MYATVSVRDPIFGMEERVVISRDTYDTILNGIPTVVPPFDGTIQHAPRRGGRRSRRVRRIRRTRRKSRKSN